MKRFCTFLALIAVLLLAVVPAFASSDEAPQQNLFVTVEDNTPVIVHGTDSFSAVRSAFVDALVSIFGEYTPLTQTVTTYFADGTSVQSVEYVSGVAGLDWVWISGAVLFCIVVYCIFRMIGGVLKWT